MSKVKEYYYNELTKANKQIIHTNLIFDNLELRKETTEVILHHTGETVLQSVERIHEIHKNSNGWSGIGYHLYVRKNGKIYEGRPLNCVGAHTYGHNKNTIGICAEGNFNIEEMQDEQINAIKYVINYVKSIYGELNIKCHRDYMSTSCPGSNYPLEKILSNTPDLQYQVHLQDLGWQNVQNAGEYAGTTGENRRIEAVRFFANNGLEIRYRVHVGDVGWQDWKKSGEIAGTTGESKRIEKIEIECNKVLKAQEHIQDVGWLPVSEGTKISIGTEGKSLRLESFIILVIGEYKIYG